MDTFYKKLQKFEQKILNVWILAVYCCNRISIMFFFKTKIALRQCTLMTRLKEKVKLFQRQSFVFLFLKRYTCHSLCSFSSKQKWELLNTILYSSFNFSYTGICFIFIFISVKIPFLSLRCNPIDPACNYLFGFKCVNQIECHLT